MANCVLVFDVETVPDLPAIARAHGLDEADEAGAREALGDRFAKHPFHRIVAIGALIAEQVDGAWQVRSLGAPHTGDRSEGELIASLVDRIAELRPQLVTFNDSGFDLPVLRYRAMVNTVSAPGLAARAYFHRYSEDALDLCDCLGSFTSNAKVKLQELCRALGLPGKPDEIDGSKVDEFVRAGRIGDVASYCEADVVNTYRVWLRYEPFRGVLSRSEFDASEDNLLGYLSERLAVKPHLAHLIGSQALPPISLSTDNRPEEATHVWAA
jgi:predicted PolB exonuclease-like 3'-5' exonuclease